MAIVNKFNVNNKQVTLDADIIENMSANDVSYNASTQYDENTVGDKLSKLNQQVIYDVTENNDGATFTSLSELLSSENLSTLIPISVRCGGMTIRFINSSDNKYVQYRYMETATTSNHNLFLNEDNWQGVDRPIDEVQNSINSLKTIIGNYGSYTPEIVQGMYDSEGNPLDSNIYSIKTNKIPFNYVSVNVSNGTCGGYIFKQNGEFVRKANDNPVSSLEVTRSGEEYYISVVFFNTDITEIHPNNYSSLNVSFVLRSGIIEDIEDLNEGLNVTNVKLNSLSDIFNKNIGTDIIIEQGIYNDNGEPVDNIYAIRTPLMEFEYLKIWTTTNSDGFYCTFVYDENKRFLGTFNNSTYHRGVDVLCANSVYNEGSIKYVAFYFVNANVKEITPQDFDSLNIKLYLYSGIKSGMKKKISCVGDSITFGYGNVLPYPSFLSPYYDSVNLGISSSEWSGPTETAFWRRITNIDADTDIISIMGGTNDWLHSRAIGTLSDDSETQETSFYSALKYTAEYIINNFPNAKLFFITPIKCRDNAFGQVENGLNTLGLSLREYAQAIVDVGMLYSIPVLDLNAICNINPNYTSHQIYYLGDGCHPTSVGNERIFNKIFSFIKSL